jgi:tetratricopeptide (TPR) repeat protein
MNQDTQSIVEDVLAGIERRDPDQPFRRWLWAAPASGGTYFLQRLEPAVRGAGRKVIRLQLPSYTFDAPEHVLGQLCQHLGKKSPRDLDPDRPLHTRVRAIARPLGREPSAPLILLRIPVSWLAGQGPKPKMSDDARSVLRALLGSDLDAVVVSTQRPSWLGELLGEGQPLPALEAGEDFLLDAGRWGEVLPLARRLQARLGSSATRLPIDLQLGVASLVLGLGESSVRDAFAAAAPTETLIRTFATALPDKPAWSSVLRRLSLPRFAIPTETAESLLEGDPAVGEVALRCLASRDAGGVTFHEILRGLAGGQEGHAERDANWKLAEYYRTHDSATTASEAIAHAVPWLEHIHHLGRCGAEGYEALKGRPILSRMSRYELAWSLSVEFRAFEKAAEVYREIAATHDRDAYSHHYWAWNLDQAGIDGATARREYRRAIELEPDNPWYHSRFITFLLDNGYQADARAAFREARRAMAAAGVTSRVDLPFNLHSWVARAALDAGDLVLAEEVFAAINPQQVKEEPLLRTLRDELDVLLEVDRLGEALYPPSVAVAERWRQSEILPSAIDVSAPPSTATVPLQRFNPGRVLSIDEGGRVELLLADPTTSPPTLFTRELDRTALTRLANGQAPEVGRFLEFGTYQGDHHRIAYHLPSRYPFDRNEFLRSLRYLKDRLGEDES